MAAIMNGATRASNRQYRIRLNRSIGGNLRKMFISIVIVLCLYLSKTAPSTGRSNFGKKSTVIFVDALTINTNHDPFNKKEGNKKEEEKNNLSNNEHHMIRGHFSKVISKIYQRYDKFPKEVKFGIGAVLGYGGSRAVIQSATSILKVTGTILVIGELMHFSGICRSSVSSEDGNEEDDTKQQHCTTIQEIHASMKKIVLDFFEKVYTAVDPNHWRQLLETYIDRTNETHGPAGLAAGILIGLA